MTRVGRGQCGKVDGSELALNTGEDLQHVGPVIPLQPWRSQWGVVQGAWVHGGGVGVADGLFSHSYSFAPIG